MHLIEGLEIFPERLAVSLMEENNCFFPQIAQVSYNFCGFSSSTYTMIAISGKSFALIKKNSNYDFLDSHLNIPYGPRIGSTHDSIMIVLGSYREEEIVYYASLRVERI